jgi:hypothetical protein
MNTSRSTNDRSPNARPSIATRLKNAAARLIVPPAYEDPDMGRVAATARTIILILIAATLAAYLAVITSPRPVAVAITVSLLLVTELIAFALLQSRRVRQAATLLTIVICGIMLGASLVGGGVRSAPFVSIVIIIVAAGLLVSETAALYFSLVGAVSGLALIILELNGRLPEPLIPPTSPGFWILTSVVFLAVAGMIYLAARNLRQTVHQMQNNQQALEESYLQLQNARQALEAQVAERTAELEQRSRYLQATTEIATPPPRSWMSSA